MTDIHYEWKCQPEAETFLLNILAECTSGNSKIAQLEHDLLHLTSSKLFDWVDHFFVPHSQNIINDLEQLGYISEIEGGSYRLFYHPGAQLPRVVVRDDKETGIAVRVDSIPNFLMVHGVVSKIEGAPNSAFRRSFVCSENGFSLSVVERRGTFDVEPTYPEAGYLETYFTAYEMWQTRPRDLEDGDEMMQKADLLADEMVGMVGRDMAAWIVLDIERNYWEYRNHAAQVQKNRQDRLAMGWSNHDHHTFRSSRRHFPMLVRVFETLGFFCRERFHAGEQAGWGAQVMENSNGGFVLFLDLDMAPEELEIDFAHNALPEQDHLGTVGLWCELHGDSILRAGMHHLELQFMFDELTSDLAEMGVGMMQPFSNFTYLKQAFTAGEVWKIDPKRIQRLLSTGFITNAEADKFLHYGAIGSHLENLQRREGYKGFNQDNVSFIIKKTDPRALI